MWTAPPAEKNDDESTTGGWPVPSEERAVDASASRNWACGCAACCGLRCGDGEGEGEGNRCAFFVKKSDGVGWFRRRGVV
jgi:hypothetical protein